VTNLGLTYNLLTAYTSFIAVDSQIRLIEGQPTTVKQPLPLPQGVSDYAVGKGSFASGSRACRKLGLSPYAAAFNAPQPLTEKEEALESKDCDVKDQIRLEGITVSNGITKQEVQDLIEKQMEAINECYKKSSKNKSGLTSKALVTLTLDGKGHVVQIRIHRNKNINSPLENCIKSHLEKLHFQKLKRSGTIKIRILFSA